MTQEPTLTAHGGYLHSHDWKCQCQLGLPGLAVEQWILLDGNALYVYTERESERVSQSPWSVGGGGFCHLWGMFCPVLVLRVPFSLRG